MLTHNKKKLKEYSSKMCSDPYYLCIRSVFGVYSKIERHFERL